MLNHPIYSFFDANELNDIKTKSKYAVPEFDEAGKIKHPFGQRGSTPYTGQARGGVDPIFALASHIEEMYPMFQHEQLKQQLYTHYKDFMARPGAPQFITELEKPTGPHATYYPSGMTKFGGNARDPIVTLRHNGVKHLRIDHPDVLNIFKSSGAGMSRVYLDAWDMARRGYQKGTTGLMSTLTTRAVPLRNSVFTSVASATQAPRGFTGGLIDKTTRGRLGAFGRGQDTLLNVARLPVTAIRSAHEHLDGRMADLLHPQANNVFNRNLRSIMDPSLVDAMHTSAKARYENTAVKFMKERGLRGSSSPMRTEAPGFATGTEAAMIGRRTFGVRLEAARISPKAFLNERATWGKLTPQKAAIDGTWNGARAVGIHIHNVLGDAFNWLGDLGHEQFVRDNMKRGVDPDVLAYETRNIVGNPARSGSGRAMGYAASALPYTNVSVQGIGRTMRAVGERPVGTPMGWAVGLGTLVLLEQLTHMRSAAHMDYLQNQVSLQQREANVELALNDDPLKPTVIPMPQEQRPALAYMKDFMSKVTNIIAARHDPNVFKAVFDGISHLLASNITRSNRDAIIHGFVDIFDWINAPPMLGRMDWNSWLHGKSWNPMDSYHGAGSGSSAAAPGGQGSDAPLDSANGQMFERLMASAFGAVAHVMQIPNAAIRYQHQGHSFLESMGMAGHDWLQMSKETNPAVNNLLWETQVRLSTYPPIAETLQPALNALRKLTPLESVEGYVGGSNRTVPMTEDKPHSNDILMRQMLMVARSYNTKIQEAKKPIDDIKTQMHSVEKLGMDPTKRRAWLNERTREMADKWKLVDAYVSDLDNAMSNMAGKGVRIEDIDFSKDSSQFAD